MFLAKSSTDFILDSLFILKFVYKFHCLVLENIIPTPMEDNGNSKDGEALKSQTLYLRKISIKTGISITLIGWGDLCLINK